jgi:hypothetical protein
MWLLLLALFHLNPAQADRRLMERSAREHGVPLAVLIGVCAQESGVGRARHTSICGTKIRGQYVLDHAQSIDIAGRSLARRLIECERWPRALAAYQSGRGCRARSRHTREYVRQVMRFTCGLEWVPGCPGR